MIKTGKYKGWNVWTLSNKWFKLHCAPPLGGRIIQLDMDSFEYLFVNPELYGKDPGQTRLTENGGWLNFGGEKIWPAPQGWNSPDQWPGPPDPVLDSGEYEILVNNSSSAKTVSFKSPFDPYTGLQIMRDISLSDNRSEVKIKATFINSSNSTRKWSVWSVCQMNTPFTGFKPQFMVVCPINPESIFKDGFKVMHGVVNNPQNFKDENNNLTVSYQYIVGKVGLDSTAGWIGFVDKKTGKVFVLKYNSEKGETYPDNTSVQIWTQGRGIIYSRNTIKEFSNDTTKNPPYVEMELLSPLKEIPVGGNVDFEYQMLASTIPEDESIVTVSEIAVVAKSLALEQEKGTILFTAKYGVFTSGVVSLKYSTTDGDIEPVVVCKIKVNPFEGISVNHKMQDQLISDHAGIISVDLYDEEGHFLGEIERKTIKN